MIKNTRITKKSLRKFFLTIVSELPDKVVAIALPIARPFLRGLRCLAKYLLSSSDTSDTCRCRPEVSTPGGSQIKVISNGPNATLITVNFGGNCTTGRSEGIGHISSSDSSAPVVSSATIHQIANIHVYN